MRARFERMETTMLNGSAEIGYILIIAVGTSILSPDPDLNSDTDGFANGNVGGRSLTHLYSRQSKTFKILVLVSWSVNSLLTPTRA